MKLQPVGLPSLPYSIECSSESSSVKFRMCASVRQDLNIDYIRINGKRMVFEMITKDNYTSLRRSIDISEPMSLSKKIDFINNYLCQIAFQLNALRGNGYTGYVIIEDLEGHSKVSQSIRDNGDKVMEFQHHKNGMYYRLLRTAKYDHWSMGSRHNMIDVDIKSIPWQVVQLAQSR